uniref:Uncharacterized protein n=1 Tax=Solanum lycopersicum TaxID=4081 RepID=K4DE60_SOLLC
MHLILLNPSPNFDFEEIHRGKFYPKIGLGDHERRDEALYDDLRQQRLVRCRRHVKESRVLDIQGKNVALEKNVKDPATTKDNGRGMPHDDILDMLG